MRRRIKSSNKSLKKNLLVLTRAFHGIHPSSYRWIRILKQLKLDISNSISLCNVIKICKPKKSDKTFQVVLQLDIATYDRIIKLGNVFIGYDTCIVFDGVEVNRCFNCNEVNHSSKTCTKSPCSQNHLINDCSSQKLKCSNCTNYKSFNRDNTIKTDHAAWDITACQVYKNACAKLQKC